VPCSGRWLADLDGIYDPGQYNDRLLLGLKGVMSETEIHIMQQRLRQGLLNKARRGELRLVPPLGYVQRTSGEVVLDPDEQVQAVVRLNLFVSLPHWVRCMRSCGTWSRTRCRWGCGA